MSLLRSHRTCLYTLRVWRRQFDHADLVCTGDDDANPTLLSKLKVAAMAKDLGLEATWMVEGRTFSGTLYVYSWTTHSLLPLDVQRLQGQIRARLAAT